MTSPAPTINAVPDLVFTDRERLALAGFLAGYRGLTRDAYVFNLRQFVAWCERQGLKLFSARRTDIELYARWLEEAGRARATVASACVRWRGSTAMPRRRAWYRFPRPSTSAARAWTTSRMR
jgi:hypothetical protein